MTTYNKILIVRSDRIGDVVLSLPMATIIKQCYPECEITFAVREYTQDLLERNEHIDNILILKESAGKIKLWQNVKEIRKEKYDAAIIVNPRPVTSLMIFLSKVKKRIGTGYRWYSFLFNKKIYHHRKTAQKHELEYNISMLKEIGIYHKVNKGEVEFGLVPGNSEKARIQIFFNQNDIQTEEEPVIIVHPGSGGSAIDLPLETMKNIIDLIIEKSKAYIIITGSQKEFEICQSLVKNERTVNAAGQFDLPELIALIDESYLFIGNSTGPLHIASALNKYIIGFYPKIVSCSKERWGPYTNKSTVFEPTTDCNNCNREQCERLSCMNTIKADEVFLKIEKIISSFNYGENND